MSFWTAAVVIVAIVMIAETIQRVIRARADKKGNDESADEMVARIDELEERIRVLERIVTEDKHDLRREINRL